MQDVKLWETYKAKPFSSIEEFEVFVKSKNNRLNFYELKNINASTNQDRPYSYVAKKNNLNIICTSDEYPIVYDNNFNEIYINTAFALKNKERLKEIFFKNIIDNKINSINIPYFLFDMEFIQKIIKNAKVDSIILQLYSDLGSTELTNEEKKQLEQYHINIDAQTENGNTNITSKYAVDNYTYEDLKEKHNITIKSNLAEREIENLKYIVQNTHIYISKKHFLNSGNLNTKTQLNPLNSNFENTESELQYYNNIFNIVKKVNDLGKNATINFSIENEEIFNKSKLYNYDYNNLNIEYDLMGYTFDEYKEQEKYLDNLVIEATTSNMSPFEKYLVVYDVVKQYKEYYENENNKRESRNLKYILNNDYIVCVGFAKLLVTLLKRVGINSVTVSNPVDTSYDKGYTTESVATSSDGHVRVLVNIKDEKYNIDGYYIADPTWDNNLKSSYYNHAVMTFDETTKEDRYNQITDIDLLFNVNTIEEYFEKVNILLERSIKYEIQECRKMSISKNENEIIKDAYANLINYMLDIFIKLDNSEMQAFTTHYKKILEKADKIVEKDYAEIIAYFGNYVINKTNKKVSGETIINAAMVHFQGVEDEESLERYKKQVLEDNINRQNSNFPERTIEYNDERESEIISDENKFSI